MKQEWTEWSSTKKRDQNIQNEKLRERVLEQRWYFTPKKDNGENQRDQAIDRVQSLQTKPYYSCGHTKQQEIITPNKSNSQQPQLEHLSKKLFQDPLIDIIQDDKKGEQIQQFSLPCLSTLSSSSSEYRYKPLNPEEPRIFGRRLMKAHRYQNSEFKNSQL